MSARRNKLKDELSALAARPDSKIDTSEIPEIAEWSRAVVGKFYRPIKQSVTIRLDADVLAWLKSKGGRYQTRINQLLRGAMAATAGRRRGARSRR
jgi:uncharacterized protein (DUF4415 family)